VKFLSRLFTALNLLPSMATLAVASRPISRQSSTKRAHTLRSAKPLSLRKIAAADRDKSSASQLTKDFRSQTGNPLAPSVDANVIANTVNFAHKAHALGNVMTNAPEIDDVATRSQRGRVFNEAFGPYRWLAYALPCNASLRPSRATAHDSGPMWIATPSSQGTCNLYSLPVSGASHMFSALPSNSDIARRIRHVSSVPTTENAESCH
jgi:hypothetical protein